MLRNPGGVWSPDRGAESVKPEKVQESIEGLRLWDQRGSRNPRRES